MFARSRDPANEWATRPHQLPSIAGGLTPRRRMVGLAICLLGLPLLTAVLVSIRDRVALDSVLVVYLLAVVVIAVLGGIGVSLFAALASFLLANWFLTPPYSTFEVEGQGRLVDLLVYVIVAALVSITVDIGARDRARAERNQMEARLLSRLTSGLESGPQDILEQTRLLFGMTAVSLRQDGPEGVALASAGIAVAGPGTLLVPAGPDLTLTAHGPELRAEDDRLLRTLAVAAGRAWEQQRLGEQAQHARQLAETDRVRSALLAAVGHDLRTPLASIKAAVSSLRQTDLTWTPANQDELLGSIEESTDRLTAVISNLLAMSRIQAGALSVHLGPVRLDEAVAVALLGLGDGDERVDVPESLPPVLADAGLLERILANLIGNARRFSPPDLPPIITARADDSGSVELRVSDHGPGVPMDRWEEMFAPFQTLGDRDPAPGLGMGLAIARGLAMPMGITLQPSNTPGGGLTMTLDLKEAR